MGNDQGAKDYIWEEYALIQAKIDKIGDFRFQVKGWAVTLVASLSIGASAASLPAPYLLITFPIVLVFWLIEENQKELQGILIGRALAIERSLSAQDKVDNPSRMRLGRWMVMGLKSLDGRRRFVSKADRVFYFFLVAILAYMVALSALAGGEGAKDRKPSTTVKIDNCAAP